MACGQGLLISDLNSGSRSLRKPCLDFVVAFERAVEANVDPVFPALKAMAEPMAETDPCSAGTLLMIDSLENKGLDVTAAFREATPARERAETIAQKSD